MEAELIHLAEAVGEALLRRRLMIATAESCTGGWAAEVLTAVAGSSRWFERGYVTYSNLSKQELLGVAAATLETHGAVSEQTAREMAAGALTHSRAQISLAVTGIAGPGGAVLDKPVGTVCFAWCGIGLAAVSRTAHFQGDRAVIRRQAVVAALSGVLELIAGWREA